MEAGDVGEEEGMNDGDVDETMIVVGLLLLFNALPDSLTDRNPILRKEERNVQEKQPSRMRRV
jgi:hypothetical protein